MPNERRNKRQTQPLHHTQRPAAAQQPPSSEALPTVDDDPALRRLIHRRTMELLAEAEPLCRRHRARLPAPEIRFDLRGQAAGQVQWQRRKAVLRYNLEIARRHTADFLATTVTHEVAHLVTTACHGRVRPHGEEWRAVMAYFGIDQPSRCHDYTLEEAGIKRQRRWSYRCDCRDHALSTTRHNRARTGSAIYHCRYCGSALRPTESADD